MYIHKYEIIYTLIFIFVTILFFYMCNSFSGIFFCTIFLLLFIVISNFCLHKINLISINSVFIISILYYYVNELYSYVMLENHIIFDKSYIDSARIIGLASIIVLCGLFLGKTKEIDAKKSDEIQITDRFITIVFIIFLTYFCVSIETIYKFVLIGREVGDGFTNKNYLKTMIHTTVYILPVFFWFMYKNKIINRTMFIFVLSFIIVSEFCSGTRFNIVFSMFPIIVLYLKDKKTNIKHIAIIIFITLFFLFLSNFMLLLRDGGWEDIMATSFYFKFHSEGLIYYLAGIVRYYNLNEHNYYTLETIMSLIMFLPRVLWPEKIVQIDRWILHKGIFNDTFADNHSGASSFVGPFYADFGYMSYFILFILSIVYRFFSSKLEIDRHKLTISGTTRLMLYPTVFFAYRSFSTAFFIFLFTILLLHIVKWLSKR